MTDRTRAEQMRDWAAQAIDALEERFEQVDRYKALNTDERADFWQGMTEACMLRLIRLKPEMVRHYHGEDDDG